MATRVNGSVTYNESRYDFWITWEETNIDTVNNTSDVTVKAYAQAVSSYHSYTSVGTMQIKIDGYAFSKQSGLTVDLLGSAAQQVGSTRTRTVTHNADGSYSVVIKAGEAVAGGSGIIGPNDSSYSPYKGTVSTTVPLTTIPREAYITDEALSFTIENDLDITMSNAGNFYVKAIVIFDSTEIFTVELGQVTGVNSLDLSTVASDIYQACPNATSVGGTVRLQTYEEDTYTTQVGVNKDKSVTANVNQATNKPIFTTASIANVDKSIAVKDKYDNTVITSSTSTLLGANDRFIKGYNTIRATIALASAMEAQNYATELLYRFTSATKQAEGAYSAVADVTIDLSNVTANGFYVTAVDSRGLQTAIPLTLSNIADYSPIVLYGLTATRTNNVDEETTLVFSGAMFKGYFGGGTTGVDNAIVAEYRYKETTEAWGAQTWNSITPTVDSEGAISFNDTIAGDLGSSGFDIEKSYSIEVRIYDKLSVTILEATLAKGIPVMDFTQGAVAVGQKVSTSDTAKLQVAGDISRNGVALDTTIEEILSGWVSRSDTLVYASTNTYSNTFNYYDGTVTISGDVTSIYKVGMRIKYTQSGTVKYGIITAVSYSSPNTTIRIYGGLSYQLADATITDVYISNVYMPSGFSTNRDIWDVRTYNNTNYTQNSPSAGSFYNTGVLISVPVGRWVANTQYTTQTYKTSAGNVNLISGLSTSSSGFTDYRFRAETRQRNNIASIVDQSRRATITLTASQDYYIIFKTETSGVGHIDIRGGDGSVNITFECQFI